MDNCIVKVRNKKALYAESIQLMKVEDVLGIVEDVSIEVEQLIFPADFYILDTKKTSTPTIPNMFLGRHFMKTEKTIIDVDKELFMQNPSSCFFLLPWSYF